VAGAFTDAMTILCPIAGGRSTRPDRPRQRGARWRLIWRRHIAGSVAAVAGAVPELRIGASGATGGRKASTVAVHNTQRSGWLRALPRCGKSSPCNRGVCHRNPPAPLPRSRPKMASALDPPSIRRRRGTLKARSDAAMGGADRCTRGDVRRPRPVRCRATSRSGSLRSARIRPRPESRHRGSDGRGAMA
jgi:hypothetical protein